MGYKGRIRRRIVALSALVPWLVSLPAGAEPEEFGPFDVVGAGVFLGYTFGERQGVDWGVEAFGTMHFTGEAERQQSSIAGDPTERSGFGPLLRFSALDLSRFSFTGAGHVGSELACSSIALDLELGGTLALSRDGSFSSVHTGVTLESLLFNAYARQEWSLKSYSVGGGARFMPTFGLPRSCGDRGAVEGRAFRDGGGDARNRVTRAAAQFDGRCSDATRWAARAQDECSSVLAFLQLALELLDEAAPLELVARAVRSAEQELSHTWGAAALASRFGGAKVVAHSPAPHFRQRLPRRQQLARLLDEGWVDGCLNEGSAALVAAEEARVATDADEARLSAKIALEEAEHAALGFDVVRWALSQGAPSPRSHRQEAEAATFPNSLLGPRRTRELASDYTTTARRRLLERTVTTSA
jgi:hypothetical protein